MAKRGRPTKYTPEYLKALGVKLIKWISEPSHWWLMDFAIENDMYAQQLSELALKSEYFSLALKRAHTIQESRIVQLAMAKKIDTTMAIFALKNVAGWRDKTDPSTIIENHHHFTNVQLTDKSEEELVLNLLGRANHGFERKSDPANADQAKL